jgi:hypothetical protein
MPAARVVPADALERRPHERRLPGAGFSKQHRDAGAAGQAVAEVHEGLAMALREEEKARIRR